MAGFEIIAVLGEGGFGKVYRARQTAYDREVALKVLSAEAAGQPEDLERFVREARATAALDHPNVVRVVFSGVDPASGRPFIAYELVEGEDLADMIDRIGAIPERRVLEIGLDIARALCRAHEEGIVHRDVKPANILITEDGTAKLADLGLAKAMLEASITGSDVIVGTPDYLAPEQALGERIDIRADIYALGLVLFEAATGRQPFYAQNTAGTITLRTVRDCPDPRQMNDRLSDSFAALIARLTARDRDRRPPSPQEVVAMIEKKLPKQKRRLVAEGEPAAGGGCLGGGGAAALVMLAGGAGIAALARLIWA